MKHVIIGTAGHIDHGKTSLIKAITNRNTDRLKEEQKRGISIELGFTYFDLPSGKRAGIIDVPGHERFIKNMLAGVMGIDIVLLVIAADEGVMPQTLEHLAILDLLGLKQGFIVLSKKDTVEEEWLELVMEDVKEQVVGSFLEGAPIIPVSSVTREGIDEVIGLVDKLTDELEPIDREDMPRLPIDRVFTVSGFGTIVTGTLLSGTLKVGEEIEIFPGGEMGRIRSLQVHDNDVDIAYGGQRVAVNISGLKRQEIDRGNVLAPKASMRETMMLDVKIKLIENLDRPIENRTRLRLYIGSAEVLCRIVILDKEVLNPGEEAYAQLRLEEKVVAKHGDRFIVRFYSPMFTIGGGVILEPNPNKKRRFDENAIEELEIKEAGDSADILEKIILDNSRNFPTIKEISTLTAMLDENVRKDIKKLEEEDKIILLTLTRETYVIHKKYAQTLTENIIGELKEHHKTYPLRAGMPKEEIRSKFLGNTNPRVGDRFIDLIEELGHIDISKESVNLKGFEVSYNEKQLKIKEDLINLYKTTNFMPFRTFEIYYELDHDKEELSQVLNSLISNGEFIKINEELAFYHETYKEALGLLRQYIAENGSITVAEYRDVLDTNRRVAMGLLEYFDQEKITRRDGDIRTIAN